MIEMETAVGSGMKVVCTRDELAQKLAVVGRAVSTRSSVQVLLGVQLRAEEGRLHLAATDMEVSLRASLEADVQGEGAAVVPGRLLVDLVRLLPPEDVTIEHRPEEGSVRIECGSAHYSLNGYSVEDFPRLPEVELAQTFSVDRTALLDTVARVSRAASRDESRPVLTGILVRFEAGQVVMAATDSYRLSVKETPLDGRGTRARGDRAGARAHGARAHRGQRRHRRAGRAREPGRVRHRRHLADQPPYRRTVPELQAAPAGALRARGHALAGRAPRRRAPHGRARGAQLAAAACASPRAR